MRSCTGNFKKNYSNDAFYCGFSFWWTIYSYKFIIINTVDIRLSHRQIQYQRYEIGSCDHSYFDFLSKSMNHTLSYQGKTTEVWHQFHSFYICTKSPNLITRNPLTCAPIHCCIQLIMIPPTWQTEIFFCIYVSFEYCMNVQDRVHFKYLHEKRHRIRRRRWDCVN